MPSLKYVFGSAASRLMHAALRNRWLPLAREVPHGLSVWYDIQRLAGQRDVGVIFDVGANVGQTAYQLVRYFPKSEIHCFEPVRGTFEELQARYGSVVKCHRLAFGSERSDKEISTSSNSELNSFSEVRDEAVSLGTELVSVDTIDQFCKDNSIEAIDVLKMDVQGWEKHVLIGASDMLKSRSVSFVLAEVGFRSRDRDMQDFAELNSFLESLGFELCGFYDGFRWGPGRSYLGFANALYQRPI